MQELSIDKLGPFPLQQLAAAVLVLGAFAIAIYGVPVIAARR
jgi:hypothetical protein